MADSLNLFRFKHFVLHHGRSTLKVGTDSVLLAAAVPLEGVRRVCDVGCGCGVIGFAIADRLQRADVAGISITGIDVDADSISECRENATIFPQKNSVQFDFQQIAVQQYGPEEKFDLVVCNPPFFAHSLKPEDGKRLVSRHRDDTLPFGALVSSVARWLAPDGKFYVIIPVSEVADFESEAASYFHICERMELRPTPTKPAHRMILGMDFGSRPERSSQLTIRNGAGEFTVEYRALTKDFYLAF